MWGQAYPRAFAPGLSPWAAALPLHLGALRCLPGRPGPLGHPGPPRNTPLAPALPAAPAYLGGQEGLQTLLQDLVAPRGFSHWDRVRELLGPPSSAWDGAPTAAACHVAGHVTALPCCLELGQAEAEGQQQAGQGWS